MTQRDEADNVGELEDATLLKDLRRELEVLLHAAVRVQGEIEATSERVDQAHEDEIMAIELAREEDVVNLNRAVQSRDVIGQAKGITMIAMRCTADQAFNLLRAQSQAENRKLVDVATEIVERAHRRFAPNGGSGPAVPPALG